MAGFNTVANYGNLNKPSVGVLGATSMVGKSLLPRLADAGWHVEAFSRQARLAGQLVDQDARVVFWPLERTGSDHAPSLVGPDSSLEPDCAFPLSGGRLGWGLVRQEGCVSTPSLTLPLQGGGDIVANEQSGVVKEKITHWICLTPIWVLQDYFPMLTAYLAKRVVALSSTSIFTKKDSPDPAERNTADKLRNGEQRFIAWAEANRIEWVILRLTLIYGLGQDRNICEIARFIARFGFFPLFGAAQGLRQPVHVEDVATACIAALQSAPAANHAYDLSGAERLTYREMVARVFRAMDKPARFIAVPLPIFRLTIACLRMWPGSRSWSAAMAERMNTDLVFDHADAVRDIGFSPRTFQLNKVDLQIFESDKSR